MRLVEPQTSNKRRFCEDELIKLLIFQRLGLLKATEEFCGSADMLAHVLCVGFAGFVAYTARPGASDSSMLIPNIAVLIVDLLACSVASIYFYNNYRRSVAYSISRVLRTVNRYIHS